MTSINLKDYKPRGAASQIFWRGLNLIFKNWAGKFFNVANT
jgi:hypothetical protein